METILEHIILTCWVVVISIITIAQMQRLPGYVLIGLGRMVLSALLLIPIGAIALIWWF